MATLYWYGGNGNASSATGHWSTNSGNSPAADHVAPTSADDVVFDTLSNASGYTCTMDATFNCASITIANPATGTVTIAGNTPMNVYGNFAITSSILWTYVGTLTFASTSTGKTVDTNSISLGTTTVIFDGVGGGWTIQNPFTNATSRSITLTNGSLDTNGKTITTGTFSLSNSNTRTLTLGASTINFTIWDATTTTGLTFNKDTATWVPNASSAFNFLGGGLTYNDLSASINMSASAKMRIIGNNTFSNITLVPSGAQQAHFHFSDTTTVTGTFTVTGNSNTVRSHVSSDVLGTQATINAATVAISNADFNDIIGAGAGNWDLTGSTGSPVNFGNCTGITFNTTQVVSGQIGYTTVGAFTDSGNQNLVNCTPFFTDAVGGTILKMKYAAWSTSGTSHVKIAVYTNTAGAPGTLVKSSTSLTCTRTTAPTTDSEWVSDTLNSGTLSANTWYWLVADTDNNDVKNGATIGYAPLGVGQISLAFASFPGTLTGGINYQYSQSLYVTYGTAPVINSNFFSFF